MSELYFEVLRDGDFIVYYRHWHNLETPAGTEHPGPPTKLTLKSSSETPVVRRKRWATDLSADHDMKAALVNRSLPG